MADAVNGQVPKAKRPLMPTTTLGIWAVVLAVLGVAWFFIGPVITMNFRTTYPITDSWVMPTIGMLLIDTAALVNVLAVWRSKEQSWVGIFSLAITGALAAFVTLFVVGEGIGSMFGFTD